MPITEFCVRNVVCASRDTSIVDAAALMRHRHVGDVIVIDQVDDKRVPVGIVTDRDIVVEVVAAGLDPESVKLGDLVPGPPATIEGKRGLRRDGSPNGGQGRSPAAGGRRSGRPGRHCHAGRYAPAACGTIGSASELASRGRRYESVLRP
jgi:hypothetical protein